MSLEEALEKKDIQLILKKKKQILLLLKSLDKNEREKAWKALKLICENSSSSITQREKLYIRSLLWNKFREVREDAWRNLYVYKLLSIRGVDRMLTAKSDKLKFSAWSNVLEMLRLNLINREDVISSRHSFWKLLKSRQGTIRKKSWKLLPKLIEAKIFLNEDKERFLQYLEHKKFGIRVNAWSIVQKLLEIGFLKEEDIKDKFEYIESISKLKTRIGYRARDIVNKLKK